MLAQALLRFLLYGCLVCADRLQLPTAQSNTIVHCGKDLSVQALLPRPITCPTRCKYWVGEQWTLAAVEPFRVWTGYPGWGKLRVWALWQKTLCQEIEKWAKRRSRPQSGQPENHNNDEQLFFRHAFWDRIIFDAFHLHDPWVLMSM